MFPLVLPDNPFFLLFLSFCLLVLSRSLVFLSHLVSNLSFYHYKYFFLWKYFGAPLGRPPSELSRRPIVYIILFADCDGPHKGGGPFWQHNHHFRISYHVLCWAHHIILLCLPRSQLRPDLMRESRLSSVLLKRSRKKSQLNITLLRSHDSQSPCLVSIYYPGWLPPAALLPPQVSFSPTEFLFSLILSPSFISTSYSLRVNILLPFYH